jgi:riboflavin kinase/FMN adenylyltransferase
MVNIGIRPTFEQHELVIEVNLFDFSDDLYGQDLILFFVDRIRDEMKFPDIEALKHQISLDKARIEELLTGRNHADSYTK